MHSSPASSQSGSISPAKKVTLLLANFLGTTSPKCPGSSHYLQFSGSFGISSGGNGPLPSLPPTAEPELLNMKNSESRRWETQNLQWVTGSDSNWSHILQLPTTEPWIRQRCGWEEGSRVDQGCTAFLFPSTPTSSPFSHKDRVCLWRNKEDLYSLGPVHS